VTARKTILGTGRRAPRLTWRIALVLPFLAAPVYGQSLGDLARQERARKQTEAPATTHVYTNEDLARQQILIPQDRDRIQAEKQKLTPPVAPAPQSTTSEANVNPQPNATTPNATSNTNANANSIAIVDDKPNPSASASANASQNEKQNTIATAQPNLNATPSPSTSANATASVDPFSDPNVDPNALPLGDIARHYRALKAARQQQESQATAARHPLPTAPVLADPIFVQPAPRRDLQPRPAVPLGAMMPPTALRVIKAEAAPEIRYGHARTSTIPEAEKLAPPMPLATQIAAPIRVRHDLRVQSVRVQTGDTLWTLARKYLGRGTDWALLAARNPQVADPTRLEVGTLLNLPGTTRALATDSEGTQRVRVAPGESLWKLSHARFGNGAAWSCIAEANPELKNANLILPGQVLTIPSSCTPAATARVGGAAISVESSAVSAPRQ
jgi:nucleoid-associated protein YgaU